MQLHLYARRSHCLSLIYISSRLETNMAFLLLDSNKDMCSAFSSKTLISVVINIISRAYQCHILLHVTYLHLSSYFLYNNDTSLLFLF
jgi:hypothetical protein